MPRLFLVFMRNLEIWAPAPSLSKLDVSFFYGPYAVVPLNDSVFPF